MRLPWQDKPVVEGKEYEVRSSGDNDLTFKPKSLAMPTAYESITVSHIDGQTVVTFDLRTAKGPYANDIRKLRDPARDALRALEPTEERDAGDKFDFHIPDEKRAGNIFSRAKLSGPFASVILKQVQIALKEPGKFAEEVAKRAEATSHAEAAKAAEFQQVVKRSLEGPATGTPGLHDYARALAAIPATDTTTVSTVVPEGRAAAAEVGPKVLPG